MKTAPHYLLLTGSQQTPPAESSDTNTLRQQGLHPSGGSWHFVLEPIGKGSRVEADEFEPGVTGERLNLLAVVRGIEALEQPSRVTLITPSKYVGRGIRSGIAFWREHNWHWERFGEMAPVKHDDLWKRIDRAMQFHKIDCRIWSMGGGTRSGRASNTNLSRALRSMAIGNRINSQPQNGDTDHLSSPMDHNSGSPYEMPFASNTRSGRSLAGASQRQPHGRRKIVLTTERMNDPLANLEDIEQLAARHRKLFKATRKGWTRVTEISPEVSAEEVEAKAFGCSVN